MTLEEIETFADTYIEIIKQVNLFDNKTDWEKVKTAFIDGAKTAVLGGIDWKQ